MKENLGKSNITLEHVFNTLTDLVAVQDSRFTFLMMNKAYQKEFKYFFGTVVKVGDNMFEKLNAPTQEAVEMKKVWERAYRSGNFEMTRTFTGSDKKKGTYSITFNTLFDDAGKQIGMVHVVRNITEKNTLAQQLQESELRFKGAFENSSIGMAVVSLEGEWLQVNEALSKVLGYTPNELLKKTFQEITYKDDLDKDLTNVESLLAGKRDSYRMEKRYIHKDGSIVWALLSVSIVRDKTGTPKYFVSQIQDINYRKQIEQETKKSLDELARMNKALVGREVKMRELKAALRACKEKTEHE